MIGPNLTTVFLAAQPVTYTTSRLPCHRFDSALVYVLQQKNSYVLVNGRYGSDSGTDCYAHDKDRRNHLCKKSARNQGTTTKSSCSTWPMAAPSEEDTVMAA